MSYPGYEYDQEDDDEYYDWYGPTREEEYRKDIFRQQQVNPLELWFLGSLFFDLGEWDLFPDQD